jgi:TrmH family RNA methyltransferase
VIEPEMDGTPAMTIEIASTTNHRVKAWFTLQKRSVRNATGLFLIEGRRESDRAIPHVDRLELIWCEDYADEAAPRGATTVSTAVFDKISRRQHPDGVAVIARIPDLSFDQFRVDSPALVLVADGIEKPGNIGAILRTCDALGAAFVGSSLATDLVNPNVVRAAQGSLFGTPTAFVSREDAIAWCSANTQVLVTRPDDSVSLWGFDLTGPTSIVIGAEAEGVAQAWSDVGVGITIPMSGHADSMNTSVTAAIVLAEASRQRS